MFDILLEELSEIFSVTECVKPVAVCSNRATSTISGFQVDACSSSSSGGSLAFLCKICRQTMNIFPQKRKNAGEKSQDNLVDLLKEYRLEQKLKEEEREKTSRKCT